MTPPPVTVIVLTWGRYDETVQCIESLHRLRYEPLEILVVDNASGDDYVARLQARFPALDILRSDLNLGYAGGNNLGIARALERGAAYVLVLNNDTVVDPQLVGAMVEVAQADPAVAAVGPRVMQFENPERVYCIGGHLTWKPPLIELDGFDAPASEVKESRDMEMVPGCGALLRSSALQRIGCFDERFFAYHEDVDWCTRARKAGFRVVYAADAVLFHRHAPLDSRPRIEPYVHYFHGRNGVLYARKHATTAQWLMLLTRCTVWLVGSFLKRLVMPRHRQQGMGNAVLVLRGLIDGLFGREIPYERLGLRPRPPR